jgi:hypothetical protein
MTAMNAMNACATYVWRRGGVGMEKNSLIPLARVHLARAGDIGHSR